MISSNGWDREYATNKEHYQRIMDKVFSSESEDISFLETTLKEVSGRKYVVATNSATDALYLSLVAYGIGLGDEVLVTDFSWISTSSCISLAGATPVFCDIDLDTYHISLDSIKRMYSNKVKALIYTPLYGNMTETAEILAFCEENNIIFIEDSAQAIGSSFNGVKAGSVGHCSSYSFNTNKVIAGIAGGGSFMTDDEEIAHKVMLMRRHGKNRDFETIGINSKMLPFNCEVINYRLSNMVEHQSKRQEIAAIYNEEFEDQAYLQVMGNGVNHNYHKYVVRFDDKQTRDRIKKVLQSRGISAGIHYEKPLSTNSVYSKVYHKKDECVNSMIAAQTVLTLPVHAWLTDEEIESIINTVAFSI